MINLCIADNFPVVHFGMKAYFKDHPEINVVSNVGNFFMVPDALRNKEIDVLIIDLELEGLRVFMKSSQSLRIFQKQSYYF